MAILTLKNRSIDRPFIGMFDGETYTIEPDGTLAAIDHVAFHLKRQSILKDNPIDPRVNVYQLAIVERKDESSPLKGDAPIESLDRSDMDDFRKVEYRKSNARPAAPPQRASITTSPGSSA